MSKEEFLDRRGGYVTCSMGRTMKYAILFLALAACAKPAPGPAPEKPLASVWKSETSVLDLSDWADWKGSTSNVDSQGCHFVRTITPEIIYEFNSSCGKSDRFFSYQKSATELKLCSVVECEVFR